MANSISRLPHREGTFIDYSAPTLSRLDPIWNDLMIQIAARPDENCWYVYNSHPWFALATPETERATIQAYRDNNVDSYFLYGSDSLLDEFGVSQLTCDRMVATIGRCSKFSGPGFAVVASKGFTIECSFPSEAAHKFASIFEETKQLADLSIVKIKELYYGFQGRWKIKVHKSRRRADSVRDAIAPSFSRPRHGYTSINRAVA